MAKQDDWARITVRLPPELHSRLLETVAVGPNSLNAEIVHRLQRSFKAAEMVASIEDENLAARVRSLGETVALMQVMQEQLAKLPPGAALSMRQAVDLALNSMVTLSAEDMEAQASNEKREANPKAEKL